MFSWLREYGEANPQTKYFVLNALIYGLAIIITSAYCYGRLDFVRSYRTPGVVEAEQKATLQKNTETTHQLYKQQ
jgi:hypothetical protein